MDVNEYIIHPMNASTEEEDYIWIEVRRDAVTLSMTETEAGDQGRMVDAKICADGKGSYGIMLGTR